MCRHLLHPQHCPRKHHLPLCVCDLRHVLGSQAPSQLRTPSSPWTAIRSPATRSRAPLALHSTTRVLHHRATGRRSGQPRPRAAAVAPLAMSLLLQSTSRVLQHSAAGRGSRQPRPRAAPVPPLAMRLMLRVLRFQRRSVLRFQGRSVLRFQRRTHIPRHLPSVLLFQRRTHIPKMRTTQ